MAQEVVRSRLFDQPPAVLAPRTPRPRRAPGRTATPAASPGTCGTADLAPYMFVPSMKSLSDVGEHQPAAGGGAPQECEAWRRTASSVRYCVTPSQMKKVRSSPRCPCLRPVRQQVVALEVHRHQANRRRRLAERPLHDSFLAFDVHRQVDLEHRDVGSPGEAVRAGVQAGAEDDDGVDIWQRVVELLVDEALAAGQIRPQPRTRPLGGRRSSGAGAGARRVARTSARSPAGRNDSRQVVVDQAALAAVRTARRRPAPSGRKRSGRPGCRAISAC